MKRLVKYFFEGLLFTIPLAVSIYIVYIIFQKIDGLLNLKIPGLGFITTLALITFLGFLTSNLFTKGIMKYIDRIFNRIPLIKLIYSTVKDIIEGFVGEKKKFDKPVLVTISKENNINVLGFITRETLECFNINDKLAVYIPQSYNFGGNVIIIPKSSVQILDTDSAELMTFIMSGGIAGKQE